MPHRTAFDATIAANASKFSVGAAAAGTAGSLLSVDWVAFVGISTGLIAFVVQIAFSFRNEIRQKRDEKRREREEERREKESAAYLASLKAGHITPPHSRGRHER